MYKVGLTGGIGSGKSIICRIFSLLGVAVFHSDMEARRIMDYDTAIRTKLTELFGLEIYPDGILDRQKLAALIFSDQRKLKAVNSIVHPAVFQAFEAWLQEMEGEPYIIKEAAIIFESGAHRNLDYIVAVTAPVELRLKRVTDRNGVEERNVLERMKNQMSEEELVSRSHFVIVNDGSQLVVPQVLDLHSKFLEMANDN
ncbi:MAG: dephospho-CoA kinase [Bacteroidales bacterium]|nr:MAG: dephospho-CoA kinase [Bacteroidales bacterium]